METKNDLHFYSGGLRLDGNIFYPNNKKAKNPAVIFVHGSASQRGRFVQYAKALTKLGYICLVFDLRGHGTSEGDINTSTIKEFLDDVISAYDYISNLNDVDTDKISVVGSSFGCYLVCILSEKRKIKKLVLRAPADYPNEEFSKSKSEISNDLKIMPWRSESRKDTYSLRALSKFENDVLIVESENDEQIPKQTIINFMNAVKNKNKLTHTVIKGAPHTLSRNIKFVNKFEKILVKWFG